MGRLDEKAHFRMIYEKYQPIGEPGRVSARSNTYLISQVGC